MATPLRNVRVADALWLTALAIAEDRGETLSSVMVAALGRYVDEHNPPVGTRPVTEAWVNASIAQVKAARLTKDQLNALEEAIEAG